MAACVFQQRLEQKTHYRSAEMMLVPAEEMAPRRQNSFDKGLASPWQCDAAQRSKVRLVHDGCVQVCRVVHGSTLLSKLLNTRYLRRWEMHHLYITDVGIHSKTVSCWRGGGPCSWRCGAAATEQPAQFRGAADVLS